MSMVSGIQGDLLDVTVVGCSKLKDTEWISRQDPYVFLEYASTKFRTRTCTDGGKNPVFQEKTVIPLIEGLREISFAVWNSNTLKLDDFIGSGKIQLHKVLSQGYDDSSWPLQTKSGRYAGELRLIMHYPNAHAQKPQKAGSTASAYLPAAGANLPPYGGAPCTHHPATGPYPPVNAYGAASPYHPPASYPTATSYPPPTMHQQYDYPPTMYPPPAYPQQPYPPPQQAQPYLPPQQAQPYPPPQHLQPYYYPQSSGLYPGAYPPPPPYY